MIKLICIDLDGTLLQRHHIISKENMKAIEYAKNKGVLIGVNTGRNSASAVYFSELAGMNAPVSSCGGGLVLAAGDGNPKVCNDVMRDVYARKTLKEDLLPRSAIELANKLAREMNVAFYAHGKGGFYLVGDKKSHEFIKSWDKPAQDIIKMGIRHFADFDEFMEETAGSIVKMGFTIMDKEKLHEMTEYCQTIEGCQFTVALGCVVEVTKKGSSKGSAVEFIREMYGFSKDEVAGIGDDTNDIAMFSACGTSIAVGDGFVEARNAADIITKGCEDDGVAEAIYRVLS